MPPAPALSDALPAPFPWYALLMLMGLTGAALAWGRRFKREPEMIAVYAAGLLGALVGAKLGYLLAEGHTLWGDEHVWRQLATGKTILGALLGGYLGVLGGKKLIGRTGSTGDAFALVIPLGLVLGRVGCVLHGCCLGTVCTDGWWALHDAQGQPHLPAPLFEAAFNLTAWVVLWVMYRRGVMRGQLFHLYLMAYAVFRLVHEPWRDTPRLTLPGGWSVSSYQLIAMTLLIFAAWRFEVRRKQRPLAAK